MRSGGGGVERGCNEEWGRDGEGGAVRSGGGGMERGCNEEWGRDGEGGAVRSGGGMERGVQ